MLVEAVIADAVPADKSQRRLLKELETAQARQRLLDTQLPCLYFLDKASKLAFELSQLLIRLLFLVQCFDRLIQFNLHKPFLIFQCQLLSAAALMVLLTFNNGTFKFLDSIEHLLGLSTQLIVVSL
jgi:hypothetical protein